MKINVTSNYFKIIIILSFVVIWYSMFKKDKDYNIYRCETKKLEIKGIIDKVGLRANYSQVRIKGNNSFFSLNIEETKFKKGFTKYYTYNIGDSIIKKANSKEFTIKRGNNIAIYILDCDD